MLTGLEIIRQVKLKNIHIDNFDESKVNPNSYNLHLGNKLLIYSDIIAPETPMSTARRISIQGVKGYIDAYEDNPTKEILIPDDGYILMPNQLYLGTTVERTFAKNCVPCISGRSSIGRLGISIHVTAGFGDIGFDGKWTLEIGVLVPVKIYPNMEICQIYFEEVEGDSEIKYKGKYQFQDDVQPSKLFIDTIAEMRLP